MSVRMARLGDVCARISDGTHQAPNWAASGVPFLFVSNIRNGTISFETSKFVSRAEYEKLTKNCPIEAGDVLYTAVGSYGNSAVVPSGKTFVFQRHIAHLKPRHDLIDATYLSQMLETPPVRRQADKLARGVAQKTVTLSSLRDFEIPLPPLDEQKRIAAILDKADQLRQKRRQAIALLDSVTQSFFLKMFGEQKHTRTVALSEVTTKITDGAHFTPTYVEQGTPFLRVTDIQEDCIDWNSVKRIPKKEHDVLVLRCNPQKGDVLLSKNGTIGITKIVDWENQFSIFVSLALLKPNKALIVPDFLEAFLKSSMAQAQFSQHSKAGTVTNLHLREIRNLQIPLPQISHQKAWQEINISLRSKLQNLKAAAATMDILFKSLQHRAFSGQL